MERKTRQRDAIEQAFHEAGRPLSPGEVLDEARRTVPTVNLATVYRGIKALLEAERIQAVDIPGEPPRYELAGLEHHHHFRCDDCERVFDIPGCDHEIEADVPEGFSVRAHEVVLFGSCVDCATPAQSRSSRQRRRA